MDWCEVQCNGNVGAENKLLVETLGLSQFLGYYVGSSCAATTCKGVNDSKIPGNNCWGLGEHYGEASCLTI
jgi:hypothetical protein